MHTNSEFPEADNIYNGDPLAGILVNRWHLDPWRLGAIMVLVGLIYMGGLSAFFGCFLPRADIKASASQDIFNQLNFFLLFPVVGFYYLFQPLKIRDAYMGLSRQIDPQGSRIGELLKEIDLLTTQKRWWLVSLGFALLFMGSGVYDNYFKLDDYWYADNWLMIAGLQIIRGLIMYMILRICTRHLITFIGLSRVYKQFKIPTTVLPCSPTYGMRAVADYAFTFTAFLAVVGVSVLSAPVLSKKIEVAYPVEAALYLLLAPIGFFAPLWQSHREMLRSRDRAMDDLAAKYQTEYEQLLNKLAHHDADAEEVFGRLRVIQESYDLIKKSWTWPFDTSTFYKVIATILSPLSFLLLQVTQDYISYLIAKIIKP